MSLTPVAVLLYEAMVDIGPTISTGLGSSGERRIVNITGGKFQGPRLSGRVLPGGADRQLVRPDGILLLDALYEMQTDDGTVLTVRNRVKVVHRPGAERRAFSHVDITAPSGAHEWLNEAVLVGTAQPPSPDRPAVRIRVFELT